MSIAAKVANHCSNTKSLQPYIWCVTLLGVAMGIDFWHISPEIILSLCSTGTNQHFIAIIMQHIATHLRWFPVSSLIMLSIVWANTSDWSVPVFRSSYPDSLLIITKRHFLSGVIGSCCMLGLMGITMTMMLTLSEKARLSMGGDGIVSAMICGMALYHILAIGWSRLLQGSRSAGIP